MVSVQLSTMDCDNIIIFKFLIDENWLSIYITVLFAILSHLKTSREAIIKGTVLNKIV